MNTRSGIIHKLRMGRVPGNYLLNLTRKKIYTVWLFQIKSQNFDMFD